MSYLICFWDKSKIQISDDFADKLKQAILAESIKGFDLNGNLYMVSGIEKIIRKEDAWGVFPEEWQTLQNLQDIEPQNNLPELNSGERALLE